MEISVVLLFLFTIVYAVEVSEILPIKTNTAGHYEDQVAKIVKWRQPVCVIYGENVLASMSNRTSKLNHESVESNGKETFQTVENTQSSVRLIGPEVFESLAIRADSWADAINVGKTRVRTLLIEDRVHILEREDDALFWGKREGENLVITPKNPQSNENKDFVVQETEIVDSPVVATIFTDLSYLGPEYPICENYEEAKTGPTQANPIYKARAAQITRSQNLLELLGVGLEKKPSPLHAQLLKRSIAEPGMSDALPANVTEQIAKNDKVQEAIATTTTESSLFPPQVPDGKKNSSPPRVVQENSSQAPGSTKLGPSPYDVIKSLGCDQVRCKKTSETRDGNGQVTSTQFFYVNQASTPGQTFSKMEVHQTFFDGVHVDEHGNHGRDQDVLNTQQLQTSYTEKNDFAEKTIQNEEILVEATPLFNVLPAWDTPSNYPWPPFYQRLRKRSLSPVFEYFFKRNDSYNQIIPTIVVYPWTEATSTPNIFSTEDSSTPEISSTEAPSTSEIDSTVGTTTLHDLPTEAPSTSETDKTESTTTLQDLSTEAPSTSETDRTESTTTLQDPSTEASSTSETDSTEGTTTLQDLSTEASSTSETDTTESTTTLHDPSTEASSTSETDSTDDTTTLQDSSTEASATSEISSPPSPSSPKKNSRITRSTGAPSTEVSAKSEISSPQSPSSGRLIPSEDEFSTTEATTTDAVTSELPSEQTTPVETPAQNGVTTSGETEKVEGSGNAPNSQTSQALVPVLDDDREEASEVIAEVISAYEADGSPNAAERLQEILDATIDITGDVEQSDEFERK
ncbi:flocculation protein FLO11 [Fopius arisanus]|uniref:Flocculation protein FLO11 n=1 Tax=Fopius arisanus TaxID=64838 RepID=A0A9R1TTL7_9HYME|nr:PREDICTED: flocculation protein FLO11-like [Fopius arisanus]